MLDLDGAERLVPRALDACERRLAPARATRSARRGRARAPRRAPGRARTRRGAIRPARSRTTTCSARARIEPGADAPGEPLAEERRRPAQRAVAADELARGRRCTIAPARWRARTRRGRRTPCCRRCARGCAPVASSTLGDDEPALAGARRPEAPLDVAEHAQAPRRRRRVGQRQHRQLHRIVRRDEDRQLLLEPGDGVLIARDAGRVANRPSGRRPAGAAAGPAWRPTPRPSPRRAGRSLRRSDRRSDRSRTASAGSRGCSRPR